MSAHQLQASLAGEDDGRRVVLRRIGRTLGGAEIGYEHFSRCFVDVGAAGRPTNILQKGVGDRLQEKLNKCFNHKMVKTNEDKVQQTDHRVTLFYHRWSVIRVHTDGSSRGATDAGDGVEGLTDIDVKVWRFITLVHGFICGGVISSGVNKWGQLNEVRAVLDRTLHLNR